MAVPPSLIDARILGGPEWIGSERYDINAKANTEFKPSPDGPPKELLLMIRSVLEERFKLRAHRETRELPIYEYLHSKGHPDYAIADNFFQSAFGGSFLNHQWLIAAASPTWPGAPVGNHSIIDSNGMPNGTYPLYTPTGPVLDRQVTQVCPSAVPGRACGDYAINTIQPAYQPFKGSPQLPPHRGVEAVLHLARGVRQRTRG